MRSFGGSRDCPHELSAISIRNGIRQVSNGEQPTHVSACVRCEAMIPTVQDDAILDDALVWLEQN